MQTIGDQATRSSRVTAVYPDGARSFSLEHGATFSDLADRLARLEERIGRKPLSVGVTLAA